ncbi:MAG TPA: MFS transporter, partial [Clostridiales bacterium]|nr:MFS transporter [Clostridiales bacterium]
MLSRFTYRSTFYACSSAFVVGAVINNLPSLFFVIFQDWFGVSYAQISLLVTVHFLTQLIVDAIC